MGARVSEGLTPLRRALWTVLAILLGLGIPFVVTLLIMAARERFNLPFLFLYVPGVLFIAYLTGLLPGLFSAVTSTILGFYFFLIAPTGSVGLTLEDIRVYGLPASLFFLTCSLMALTGNQYRRYQGRLQEDLGRTRQRARHEAFLVRITDALTSRVDGEQIGEQVCKECTRSFQVAQCAIILAEAESDDLRLEAFFASTADTRTQRRRDLELMLLRPDSFVGSLLGRTEPVLVARTPQDADGEEASVTGEWLAHQGFAGALFAPIRLGEESFGFLAMFTEAPRGWSDDDLRVAQSVAERLAVASGRRRRAEMRLRRERDARLLTEIMVEFFQQDALPALLEKVARRCTDVLGEWSGVYLVGASDPRIPRVTVHHKDPSKVALLTAALERTPLGESNPLTTAILKGRRPMPITVSDPLVRDQMPNLPALEEAFARLGVRSVLAVPIYVGGEALGILAVGTESARPWDEEDFRLVSAIADRTGPAIQNVRLIESERQARENAERETRRVAAVNRISALAAGSLDLRAIFDEFAEALQVLLPFVRVTVSLYEPERDWFTMPYFKGPELSAPPDRLEGPKAGTVRGWVLDSGQAYVRRDTTETQEFSEDHLLASAGIRSYAVIPMRVGGQVIGTLNFGHHEPGFYTEKHASLVQSIADQLAITVSHSRLLDQAQRRAGELSETLQRALLPVDLPRAPFTAISALYRPADPEARIGGDWYDATLLPDDSVLISIGDVTGRGLPAAAVMGQVRHVVRAYALEGRSPAYILKAVNDMLCKLPASEPLSMWVGTLDPYQGDLIYAGAGHPPPYLMEDNRVTLLSANGPPLGIAPTTRYDEQRTHLTPGARLIAYTDGLIEANRNVVEGERRLMVAARSVGVDPPERAVGALVERVLRETQPHDDIALLILDRLPLGAPLSISVQASPENLRRVRRALRTFVERAGLPPDRAEMVVIAVGEAALNVVEHAYGGRPGKLTVQGEQHGETLTITVRDFGQWRQQTNRGRGRGTRIMQGFADLVKTQTGTTGTLVELSWTLRRTTAVLP